jgi:hypothetical protein
MLGMPDSDTIRAMEEGSTEATMLVGSMARPVPTKQTA